MGPRRERGDGDEGQVVPQQWLAHSTAPGVGAEDRRWLDLVVYGATRHGEALCCDATFVSPLTRTGHPQPCAAVVDEAALKVAERRKRATDRVSKEAGPKSSSSSARRWAAAGTSRRAALSKTWSG